MEQLPRYGVWGSGHGHALIANSLPYAVHLKVSPAHQLVLAAAVPHCFAVISWSVSTGKLGFGIVRTQYYNLPRNTPYQKSGDSQ
jgi:hypothetical protein